MVWAFALIVQKRGLSTVSSFKAQLQTVWAMWAASVARRSCRLSGEINGDRGEGWVASYLAHGFDRDGELAHRRAEADELLHRLTSAV